MIARPLAFVDTETTGVSLDDDIWEFYGVRRLMDGTEIDLHLFIEHDLEKAAKLPESFRADHDARYDPDRAVTREFAAYLIDDLTSGATIVGAIPSFDTERLALLIRSAGYTPSWHYRLRCVESMAEGALRQPINGLGHAASLLGIETPAEHTAIGDVRTTIAVYDRIYGGPEKC